MSASDRCPKRVAPKFAFRGCSAARRGAPIRPQAGRAQRGSALLLASALLASTLPLAAQEAPPALPPPPLEADLAPAEPLPEVAEPPPAPAVTAPAAPVTIGEQEARATEPPPTPEPSPFKPRLTIGIGLRTGLSLTMNPGDTQLSLADSLDQLMFRPFFAGQLTKNIGVFVQLNGGADGIDVIDGYFDLKFVDELQLLIGQHIPAIDRNNFSGPFFNNSWNFAAVHSYPFDAAARDRGFTFWGLLADGIVKYHLSMVDLQPGRKPGDARFAGRVTFNFLQPENTYYFSETYFGKSDTLAVGAVVSYQNKTTGNGVEDRDMDGEIDNEFLAFSADLLFEKNVGAAGTFTLSAMYWNWNQVGSDYVSNQGTRDAEKGFAGALSGNVTGQSYQVNVSWLAPRKLGIGQLQPNFRVQGFDEDAGDGMIYDVGLGYIVDGFNHLWRINYRHGNFAGSAFDEDSLQLGAQLQI